MRRCQAVNTRPCTMLVTTAGAEGAVGGWGGVEPVVAGRCAGAHGTSAAWWCTQRRGGRARGRACASVLKSHEVGAPRVTPPRRAPCTRTVNALSRILCAAQFHTHRDQALCFICCPHTNPTVAFPARMPTKRPHAQRALTREGEATQKRPQTQTYFYRATLAREPSRCQHLPALAMFCSGNIGLPSASHTLTPRSEASSPQPVSEPVRAKYLALCHTEPVTRFTSIT